MATDIVQRKTDHIDLCAGADVQFHHQTTFFEEVWFLHNALPDIAVEDIDTRCDFVGKPLAAPVLITGMTGGTERAGRINRELAALCEELGLAFGLGSQRVMAEKPELATTFDVREVAPTCPVLGNLGVVQAREMTTAAVTELLEAVGASALCIHLNPAMEMVQPGGDVDFRHGLETIERLCGELDVPVIVKETGTGISPDVGLRVQKVGVQWLDVSGAGGTTWVGVEALRASGRDAEMGQLFWDWGLPTALAVSGLRDSGLALIASGGMRSGLDIAKAIALGASVGGVAQPVIKALIDDGREGARAYLEQLVRSLRIAMLLTGSRDLAALGRASLFRSPRFEHYASQLARFSG